MINSKGATMSIAELAQAIGKRASLDLGELKIDVQILDVKQAYGNTRYLVQPVAGSGSSWYDSGRVIVKGE